MKKQALFKILCSNNVIESIKNNEEKLLEIIPELSMKKNFEQKNECHIYDVFEHTLKVLEISENDFELRVILLLHDIGKHIHIKMMEK